jgi:hypothetical protein
MNEEVARPEGPLTVLVTVHGIGFQQPPHDDIAGYADALHEHLKSAFVKKEDPDLLGDDPNRVKEGGGPVYVRSEVEAGAGWKSGLDRLAPDEYLAASGRIAHVALVYSPSEPLVADWVSVGDTLARAAVAHVNYTSVAGALKLLASDVWAALHTTHPSGPKSTLRLRDDLPAAYRSHHGLIERAWQKARGVAAPQQPPDPGAFGILKALEDDLATYVVRNDVRERVRSFVQAALVALLDRRDVGAVVVNAHSQGTVICWDVLARLPMFEPEAKAKAKLRRFVTAGSPIRKYVDLFAWGALVGELAALIDSNAGDAPEAERLWVNFWDEHDPVADPLNPKTGWHPRERLDAGPPNDDGLLLGRLPAGGDPWHIPVYDPPVDNLEHSSGGGLQAHDYWNNQTEFVDPLADILKRA